MRSCVLEYFHIRPSLKKDRRILLKIAMILTNLLPLAVIDLHFFSLFFKLNENFHETGFI